jgi:REP element-mobilizing transposase RayT
MNLLERRSDLLVRHIDSLREAVRRTRRERPFHIDAWVVLPEHMHCIITPRGGQRHPQNLEQSPCRPSLRLMRLDANAVFVRFVAR